MDIQGIFYLLNYNSIFYHFSYTYYLRLKMASAWLTVIKSPSASRLGLILPVWGQKVKGVSPSALEVLIGSREQEPARTTDRTAIATCFGHDVDARL
jgi:hypothetical protein